MSLKSYHDYKSSRRVHGTNEINISIKIHEFLILCMKIYFWISMGNLWLVDWRAEHKIRIQIWQKMLRTLYSITPYNYIKEYN